MPNMAECVCRSEKDVLVTKLRHSKGLHTRGRGAGGALPSNLVRFAYA